MIGEGEILVIDDFVSLEYQEKIKQELMGVNNDFPWFYIEDVTAAGDFDSQHRAGFGHQYVELDDDDVSEVKSLYHHLFTPMLSKACQYLKIPEAEIIQGRSFLQLPLKNIDTSIVDSPHIDLDPGDEHTVVLYYVNDSDGDTKFFNKDFELIKRVSPKKGKVVIFHSNTLHTSSNPIESPYRMVVNFNVRLKGLNN